MVKIATIKWGNFRVGGDDDLICRVKIKGFGNINTINGMEGRTLSDREGFHQAFVA